MRLHNGARAFVAPLLATKLPAGRPSWLQGKTGQQCAQRWRHRVNPNISKEKWTEVRGTCWHHILWQFGTFDKQASLAQILWLGWVGAGLSTEGCTAHWTAPLALPVTFVSHT